MPPAPAAAPAPPLPQGTGREEVSGHAAGHEEPPNLPASPPARAGPLGSARRKDPHPEAPPVWGLRPCFGDLVPSRALALSPASPVPSSTPRPQSPPPSPEPLRCPQPPSLSPAPPACPRGAPGAAGARERGGSRKGEGSGRQAPSANVTPAPPHRGATRTPLQGQGAAPRPRHGTPGCGGHSPWTEGSQPPGNSDSPSDGGLRPPWGQ